VFTCCLPSEADLVSVAAVGEAVSATKEADSTITAPTGTADLAGIPTDLDPDTDLPEEAMAEGQADQVGMDLLVAGMVAAVAAVAAVGIVETSSAKALVGMMTETQNVLGISLTIF
jgi:hypothetical protein